MKYVTIKVPQDYVGCVRDAVKAARAAKRKEQKAAKHLKKLQRFWNNKLAWITRRIDRVSDIYYAFNVSDSHSDWHYTIRQVLETWANMAKPVNSREFSILCSRNGFSKVQREFLIEGLLAMELKGWCRHVKEK